MSYGLQLSNITSRTLLGGALKLVRFKSKIAGITPAPESYPAGSLTGASGELMLNTGVINASNPPIIYHKPVESSDANDIYAHTSLVYENGSWWAGFVAKQPTTVTAYVFEEHAQGASSGYGLQLFDKDGNLSFDSNVKPLVALAAIYVNRAADTWGYTGSYLGWTLGSAANTVPSAAAGKSIAIHCPAFYQAMIRGVMSSPQGGGGTPLKDYGIGGCRKFNNTLFFEAVYRVRTISLIPGFFATPRWKNQWVSMIDTSDYD